MFKENQSAEEHGNKPAAVELKTKGHPYLTAAIAAAVAVVMIVLLTVFLVNSRSKSRELAAALAETEEALERQKELTEDLEVYASGQKTELEKLQERVEELLNIQQAAPVITSAQIQDQLRSIRELVTQQYIYTNADRGEYHKTWLWGWDMPFGDKSLLIKYDGIIKAGIDLNEVEIDVDEETRTITVAIPASKITDHNVPQDTIQTFETKDGLFNKVTPDDSNALVSKGKEAMEAKAIERGLLSEADKAAETIVRTFLSLLPGMDAYTLNVTTK